MSQAAPKQRERKTTWSGRGGKNKNYCCTYLVCFLSVSLQEEPLLLSTALILSRGLNAQTPGATCQPTSFFFFFFLLLNPALFFKKVHTPRQASHCPTHINLFGSTPPTRFRPSPPPHSYPRPPAFPTHARGSSLPTGHCFHSACVWVSRVSFGPADGSE